MIIKVQKPLFTTGQPTVLIYNKDRSVMFQEPYTAEWADWFGTELKRYARAHIEGTIVVIDRVVADRPW
jgi:hypothetical protein